MGARLRRRSLGGLRGYRNEVMADGPLFFWMLGESSGTTAFDQTDNDYDGTYVNSPSLAQTSIIPTTQRTSVAFDTGGGGRTVDIADNAAWDVNEFTFEGVVRPGTLSGTRGIANRDNGSSDRAWYIVTSGTDLYFSTHNASNTQLEIGPATLAVDTNYHFACVRSTSTQIIYINGVAVVSSAASGNVKASANPIRVSRYLNNYGTQRLQGIAFHAQPLSAGRVLAHAQAAGLA